MRVLGLGTYEEGSEVTLHPPRSDRSPGTS